MKTTRKISIALVVVMLLMMTLAIIPASAATTVAVAGAFNGWSTTANSTSTETNGAYSISIGLSAGTYEFKMVYGGGWYGNGKTYTDTCSNVTVNSNGDNMKLVASKDGTYTFTYTTGKVLTITYTAPSCTNHNYDEYGKCTNDGCNAGHTYTVAGTLGGNGWNVSNKADFMTYDPATGTYTKVYQNVSKGPYSFKCARDSSWDIAYPSSDKNITVDKDGSTVTITLKGTTVSVEIVAPECDHQYSSVTTATCTAAGKTTYTCSVCGDVYTEDTAALGHYYEDGDCIRCDATTEYTTVYLNNAAKWENTYWYAYNSNTNANAGAWPGHKMSVDEDGNLYAQVPVEYDKIIFSIGSNASQTTELDIPADYNNIFNNSTNKWYHEHSYTVPATCIKAESCVCGQANPDAEPLGHNYVDGVCDRTDCGAIDSTYCAHKNTEVVNTATCTEGGQQYTYCNDCKKCITPEEEIVDTDPIPHSYDDYGKCKVCKTGDIYTVAGNKSLCGTDWSTDDVNNNLLYNSETKVYTIVYENVNKGYYEFKVVKNNSWTGAFGKDGVIGAELNYGVNIPTDGCDLTISVAEGKLSVVISSYVLEEARDYHLILGNWDADNARFVLYCYNITSGKNEWVDMVKADGYNYYSATVPAGYTHFIYVRMNPALPNGWDNDTWGQSEDIAVSADGANIYHIQATEENWNAGTWHTEHSYESKVTAPTCTADGYTTHTCVCGDTYTDSTTTKLGHSYDSKVTAPTCTTAGYTTHTCSACGDSYTDSETEKLPHTIKEDSEYTIITLPTAEANGSLTTDCVACGAELTLAIPALNPIYVGRGIYQVQYGTCETNKDVYSILLTDLEQKIDGAIYVTFEIAHVYEHTEVEDAAVAATCTENGKTAGSHCSVCNEVLVAQTVITASGHSFGDWEVIKEPTESNKGVKARTCKNCPETETGSIAELSHDHSRWDEITLPAKAATCTATGLTEGKKCSGCGEILVDQEIVPVLPHTEVVDAAVAATCTEPGKTEGKHCSVCDTVLVPQKTVAALGHTEVVDEGKAATCTEKGLTTGKHCSVCNTVLVPQKETDALGHDMVKDSAKAPTCTETGLTEGSHCSRCDYKVAQETVAALGHTEVVDAAVAATCTEAGKTEGKHCSVCNTVLVAQETVAALGHTEVVDAAVAATCTDAGKTEGKHCSVCNTVLVAQETVAALGHTEVVDAAVVATCTEAGKTEGKHCSVCNEVLVAQEEIKAKGHSFAEGKCSVCGAADPDYVEPKPDDQQKPDNQEPEQPEEELGFFEAIWKAIVDFFKSIGDFFAGLFGGNKK